MHHYLSNIGKSDIYQRNAPHPPLTSTSSPRPHFRTPLRHRSPILPIHPAPFLSYPRRPPSARTPIHFPVPIPVLTHTLLCPRPRPTLRHTRPHLIRIKQHLVHLIQAVVLRTGALRQLRRRMREKRASWSTRNRSRSRPRSIRVVIPESPSPPRCTHKVCKARD